MELGSEWSAACARYRPEPLLAATSHRANSRSISAIEAERRHARGTVPLEELLADAVELARVAEEEGLARTYATRGALAPPRAVPPLDRARAPFPRRHGEDEARDAPVVQRRGEVDDTRAHALGTATASPRAWCLAVGVEPDGRVEFHEARRVERGRDGGCLERAGALYGVGECAQPCKRCGAYKVVISDCALLVKCGGELGGVLRTRPVRVLARRSGQLLVPSLRLDEVLALPPAFQPELLHVGRLGERDGKNADERCKAQPLHRLDRRDATVDVGAYHHYVDACLAERSERVGHVGVVVGLIHVLIFGQVHQRRVARPLRTAPDGSRVIAHGAREDVVFNYQPHAQTVNTTAAHVTARAVALGRGIALLRRGYHRLERAPCVCLAARQQAEYELVSPSAKPNRLRLARERSRLSEVGAPVDHDTCRCVGHLQTGRIVAHIDALHGVALGADGDATPARDETREEVAVAAQLERVVVEAEVALLERGGSAEQQRACVSARLAAGGGLQHLLGAFGERDLCGGVEAIVPAVGGCLIRLWSREAIERRGARGERRAREDRDVREERGRLAELE
eukprot:scaffold269085_cov30-Tisochrysis_lutea.AAC.4